MLSPVVFHDELRSELRSSSPRGFGCRENITSEIASFADNVSTGTVRCGLPSEVNSTIPAMPIVDSDRAKSWAVVLYFEQRPQLVLENFPVLQTGS